jgi:hypothetical protein
MCPHALGEAHQWLATLLSDAMAMASELASSTTATSDPSPNDFEKVIDTAKCLLNTLKAVCAPAIGQHAATETAPQGCTYANAAWEAATTDARICMAGPAKPDPSQKKPKSKPKIAPPSSDSSSPSTRLVLRFHKPIKTPPHPSRICEALNEKLPPHTKVAGANFSRTGNLVLHALAPSMASLLAEHSNVIVRTLDRILGVKPLALDLGKRWHHIVCHQVPIPHQKWEVLKAEIGQDLTEWNKVECEDKDYVSSLVLCPQDDLYYRTHITVKITLKKEEMAWCLFVWHPLLCGNVSSTESQGQRCPHTQLTPIFLCTPPSNFITPAGSIPPNLSFALSVFTFERLADRVVPT